MNTVVQIATSADWMYLLDSAGRVWEKPLPAAQLPETWELVQPLPHGLAATSLLVTPDGAVHAVAEGGRHVFRYLSDTWEDETPPLDMEIMQ